MSEFLGVGKAFVSWVWPIRENFETGRFYGWRIRCAVGVLFLSGVTAMFLAWIFGIVTLFGTTGLADYAKASEVGDLKKSQMELAGQLTARTNDVMGVVIGGQIFDLQFKRCDAIKKQDVDLVRAYSDQLQGSLDQYYRITGRGYNLQACP